MKYPLKPQVWCSNFVRQGSGGPDHYGDMTTVRRGFETNTYEEMEAREAFIELQKLLVKLKVIKLLPQ